MDDYQWGFEDGLDPYNSRPDMPMSDEYWQGFEDGRWEYDNVSEPIPA